MDAVIVLFAGLWLWVSGAALAGCVASAKGRSSALWFFGGLVLSPLLTLVALAAVPDLREFAQKR